MALAVAATDPLTGRALFSRRISVSAAPPRPASCLLMTRHMIPSTLALRTGIAVAADAGRAGLTGAFAGRARAAQPERTVEAAALLTEAGCALSGTIVLELGDSPLADTYHVWGKRQGDYVRLRGTNPAGARLVLRAIVTANALRGRVQVEDRDTRLQARIDLIRLPGDGDGAAVCARAVAGDKRPAPTHLSMGTFERVPTEPRRPADRCAAD